MSDQNQDSGEQGTSSLERLGQEALGFLGAQVQRLVRETGEKLTGLTHQVADTAENSGALPSAGARMLKGESPGKAVVGGGAKSVKDRVTGGGGGGGLLGGGGRDSGGDGGSSGGEQEAGDTKVTNIVEVIDVGVPRRTCYDHWTQYEKFGVFTKGVRNVSQSDETTTEWKVKVGPSTRGYKATVEEQVPDDRIVWRSEGSQGTTRGAVSFHELTPTLTRIVAVVEYYPSGFFEKTANIWRAQGRRLRLDLKHFQRYVTLAPDEEVEGWRGEIRDSEVVRGHEDAVRDEGGGGDHDEEDGGDEDDRGESGHDDGDADGQEGSRDDGDGADGTRRDQPD